MLSHFSHYVLSRQFCAQLVISQDGHFVNWEPSHCARKCQISCLHTFTKIINNIYVCNRIRERTDTCIAEWYSTKYRIKLCKVSGTLPSVFTSCGAATVNWLYNLESQATVLRHFTFCCVWRNTVCTPWTISFRPLVEYWLWSGLCQWKEQPGRLTRKTFTLKRSFAICYKENYTEFSTL